VSHLPWQREPVAVVTGRFQPFHNDHLNLVLLALDRADRVLVAITNPDRRSQLAQDSSAHRHLDSANPFTYVERLRIVTAALLAAGVPTARFDVVPFPLDAPCAWSSYADADALQVVRIFTAWEADKADSLERNGYRVLRLTGSLSGRMSASEIRRCIAEGLPWEHLVPDGARAALLALGLDELRRRCRDIVVGAAT
jgi:cytidyltransferase-like protein